MSRVNIQELAAIFGVSRPTIVSWIDQGMPFEVAGSKATPWQFSTEDVLPWWAENRWRRAPTTAPADGSESYEEAERREKIAKADKAELELAKAAGLVVEVSEVTGALAGMHANVRNRLLGIPNHVRTQARSFFGEDRAAEEQVVGTVDRIIAEAMAEICDDPFGDGSAGGGMEDEAKDVT